MEYPKKLSGVVKNYDWGSAQIIQNWSQGLHSDNVISEVWFGAHPMSPSKIDGVPLDQIIAEDPSILGNTEASTQTLPFLVKLLSAENILSLQVHPSKEQAKSGFHKENAQGIPLGSSQRNYKDTNHKPEVIIALSDFTALAGFNKAEESARRLASLGIHELSHVVETLYQGNIHKAYTILSKTESLYIKITQRVDSLSRHPSYCCHNDLMKYIEVFNKARRTHPDDVSASVIFLMNIVSLKPWDYLYIPAGVLHAYVQGFGVEVMACSDNVVRGGLTRKHIDRRELDLLTLWEHTEPHVGRCQHRSDTINLVEDFTVTTIRETVPIILSDDDTARIVVPVDKTICCDIGDTPLEVHKGEALFVPANQSVSVIDCPGSAIVVSSGKTRWNYLR